MKFSCTQENLLRALTTAVRVSSRTGNLPILSNILISAAPEKITLKATNLEVGITCMLRGKVEVGGEFTIPGKLFVETVASFPREKIDLTLDENSLILQCGRHRSALKGMPAADFPLIPAVENGSQWNVSQSELANGLEQVLFTISPNEARAEISGAALSCEEGKIIIAGTDSYRLAEKSILAKGKGKLRTIVPLRALLELARICAQEGAEDGTLALTLSENQLGASLPACEFVTRLIDGQYPDYRAIVPSTFGTEAKVPRGELAAALKAAGLFSKAGVYDVSIDFSPKENSLTVQSLNSQTGEYKSTLDAKVSGAGAKIAFNWKYLLDGVNALKSEEVILKATDASSPTLLKEENSDDYFYIVMPIKE